jgi:hypothetical protein
VAQTNLDHILDRLRRLSPEELGRVTRVLDEMEAEDSQATGFESLCGIVTEPDADAMRMAIAECEQVEGEW